MGMVRKETLETQKQLDEETVLKHIKYDDRVALIAENIKDGGIISAAAYATLKERKPFNAVIPNIDELVVILDLLIQSDSVNEFLDTLNDLIYILHKAFSEDEIRVALKKTGREDSSIEQAILAGNGIVKEIDGIEDKSYAVH